MKKNAAPVPIARTREDRAALSLCAGKERIMSEKIHANRKYKDSVFRLLFNNKRKLLGLYNALNGTNYQDPELLTVTTLENAIYMDMKNDVSFLLDARLMLYEHQSTWNPNMPLRNLFFITAREMRRRIPR